MSADKHKRRDRAYAFIRSLRAGYNGFPKNTPATVFSGRPTRLMRYCVERGMATIRRVPWGRPNRRNVFDGGDR